MENTDNLVLQEINGNINFLRYLIDTKELSQEDKKTLIKAINVIKLHVRLMIANGICRTVGVEEKLRLSSQIFEKINETRSKIKELETGLDRGREETKAKVASLKRTLDYLNSINNRLGKLDIKGIADDITRFADEKDLFEHCAEAVSIGKDEFPEFFEITDVNLDEVLNLLNNLMNVIKSKEINEIAKFYNLAQKTADTEEQYNHNSLLLKAYKIISENYHVIFEFYTSLKNIRSKTKDKRTLEAKVQEMKTATAEEEMRKSGFLRIVSSTKINFNRSMIEAREGEIEELQEEIVAENATLDEIKGNVNSDILGLFSMIETESAPEIIELLNNAINAGRFKMSVDDKVALYENYIADLQGLLDLQKKRQKEIHTGLDEKTKAMLDNPLASVVFKRYISRGGKNLSAYISLYILLSICNLKKIPPKEVTKFLGTDAYDELKEQYTEIMLRNLSYERQIVDTVYQMPVEEIASRR